MQTVKIAFVGTVTEGETKVRLKGSGSTQFKVEIIDGAHAIVTNKRGEDCFVNLKKEITSIV